MRDKLNNLSLILPEGCIASVPWLSAHGYSAQLIERYHKSGRLVQLGRSAYRRLGRLPDWQDVVISLNQCWDMAVHIGGSLALELQGLGHYVRIGKRATIFLYMHGSKVLPQWVQRVDIGVSFLPVKAALFEPSLEAESIRGIEWPKSPWPLQVSVPERAVLEMLDQVPGYETFEHAASITGGLLTLKPDLLMSLLRICTSIKVKRLFLFLAEHLNLPCFQQLDVKNIDLGKGTRQIVKNGRYDSKYRITVPKDFP